MEMPRFSGKIYFTSLSMAISMAIFLIGLEMFNSGKIVHGVKLANIDVGGKKTEETKKIIENKLEKFEISLKNGNETLTGITLNDIGMDIFLNKSLEEAYMYGRNKNFAVGIKEQIFSFLFKKDFPIEYSINREKFESLLKRNFQESENFPINANIIFNKENNSFEIIEPKEGFIIDRQNLLSEINQRLLSLDNDPITLKFKAEKPKIFKENSVEAKETAEKLFNASPYFISYQDGKRKIDSETFLDWLIFLPVTKDGKTALEVSLSEEKIKDFLTQLLPVLNVPAENAKFAMENGKATAFSFGNPGRELKINESTKKILDGIIKNGKQEIELEFAEIEPTITTSSAENMGIITLLGKGNSNFAGSPQNRISNIKIGLSKIQGTLIKPGEEFSFNTTMGEIDEKNGFLPELVIKKDKLIPEIGGGICQVSTTLFRAAIYSGLEITERYPHAFPVSYYSPQGFDATVYSPRPDFKFINNTPAYILIQGKISGNTITFELYGTSDGRKVIVTKPEEYDKKEDGSMKARFERQIWQNEKLIKKEIFNSVYKSPKLYPVERPQEQPQASPQTQ